MSYCPVKMKITKFGQLHCELYDSFAFFAVKTIIENIGPSARLNEFIRQPERMNSFILAGAGFKRSDR